AKVCADAILRDLNGYPLYPTPKTNSACYSPVSATEASWLAAVFVYDRNKRDMKLVYSQAGAPSRKNYKDMFNWSGNLFYDTFM
ncbi:FCSD flavin-binding domain-containing protein, partial [Caminibacter sp.]